MMEEDWGILAKLLPDPKGLFNLSIRCMDCVCKSNNGHVDFGERSLHKVLNEYYVTPESVTSFNINKKVSFPSFFMAYCAWKEVDSSIIDAHKVRVSPIGGSLKGHNVCFLYVSKVPKNSRMSSMVTKYIKFPGLLCIDFHPEKGIALVGYNTLEAVHQACQHNTIRVDGEEQVLQVKHICTSLTK